MNDAAFRVLVLGDARSFHIERYVAELRRQGCEVLLASLEAGEIEHHALSHRGRVRTIAYALAKGEVEELIASFAPNVISAHYAAGYGYLMSRVQRGDVPLTLHVWGSDVLVVPQKSWFHKRKVTAGLLAADRIFADSHYLADAVKGLAPKKEVSVYPWGIERRHLQLHKKSYRAESPLRIIVPRMHEPVYDNFFIVEALQEEVRRGETALTFPSFGSLAVEFRGKSARIVGEKITYYDKMSRDEFLAFMAQHDVYLSAARSDSSPVSLIEAMALGLIPIAADIPGVREWLTKSSGFPYEPGNASSLRAAVGRILERKDEWGERRRCNREKVEQEAIFEDNIAAILTEMRMLFGRRS